MTRQALKTDAHTAVISSSPKLTRTCTRCGRMYVANHYFAQRCDQQLVKRSRGPGAKSISDTYGGEPTKTSLVLRAVEGGARNAREVALKTGISIHDCGFWLSSLVRRGHIRRTGYGTYGRVG